MANTPMMHVKRRNYSYGQMIDTIDTLVDLMSVFVWIYSFEYMDQMAFGDGFILSFSLTDLLR
jgi:hypothetical protein